MNKSGDLSATELDTVLPRLDALIDWERRDRGEMRVGVEPMHDLMGRLGDPHDAWPAVHVAGTKGKGSVCALVGAALERAGLRAGVYASPHVEHMRERVLVGGRPVEDGLLALGLERALDAREAALSEGSDAAHATWFDVVTAAAFWIFAREEIDWGVVEVGIGGRLDSTNVIHPEVCVVTNVDLEHTTVLGSTRALIAREKGGILETGTTFVCGVHPAPERGPDEDAGTVLFARARELEIEVCDPGIAPGAGVESSNRALAAAVLDALGRRGHEGPRGEALSAALLDEAATKASRLPGRLERRRYLGLGVVLDGAHVPASLELVLRELEADGGFPGAPEVVFSVARDKDAEGLLKTLSTRVDRVHCTSVPSGIHLSPAELAQCASQAGLEAVEIDEPAEALAVAARRASPGRWVLVTGSLYLVGALRGSLDSTDEDP